MPFEYETEVLRPAFSNRAVPNISYGLPFEQACAHHINGTLHLSRVYIIASKSLSNNTDALKRLQTALGSKVVGTRIGMDPHTHWNQVVEVAKDAEPHNPDCIITLGAGSLTDAAKVIAWMLANNITTSEGLETMYSADHKPILGLKSSTIRQISIPTSLSGGEYQAIAGVTRDDGSKQKCLFQPPEFNPSLVILDPRLTTTTPEHIWLSTGIRAVDHCVETMCSLLSNPYGDAEAAKGLTKLVPGLIRTKHNPDDLDARFDTMLGVIEAMSAVGSGVPLGASHAIGHQLGPLGVGHGETSCIMLPAVCKWNAKQGANVDRQKICKGALLEDTLTRSLVAKKFGSLADVDLGDVLDVVIRELGMPRSLKEVNVGRDKLEGLAVNSLTDQWIKTNAKPITEKSQVLEILEAVVG